MNTNIASTRPYSDTQRHSLVNAKMWTLKSSRGHFLPPPFFSISQLFASGRPTTTTVVLMARNFSVFSSTLNPLFLQPSTSVPSCTTLPLSPCRASTSAGYDNPLLRRDMCILNSATNSPIATPTGRTKLQQWPRAVEPHYPYPARLAFVLFICLLLLF